MTSELGDLRLADLILKVGRIHSFGHQRVDNRSLAIRDGVIVAVADEVDGLDRLRSEATKVVEAPDLTLQTAFIDSHEHLLESARNLGRVQVQNARPLEELIAMIAQRAARTPPGEWVQTTMGWNESNLGEGRLPTAAELDRASDTHPVLVPRGGHVCVANTLALRAAGITADMPDPRGGTIGHLDDGSLSGLLEGWLAQKIKGLVPPPPLEESVANLADACRIYAALGVGTIREALLYREDWPVYQTARERGLLCMRCRPMILVPIGTADEGKAFVEGLGARSGFGDDWLRIWGLKFVMDGGVAGAAMEQPFANDPSNTGHVNWDPDAMAPIVSHAIANGWKAATHAVGDRTVRTILDVYQRALSENPGTPAGTLVIEHACLANAEQRARAVRMGVAITVQHSLFYTNSADFLRSWGPERTSRIMPVRSWLRDGALVAAGTDSVSPFDPLLNVWGFATRETKDAGIQGPEEAIDVKTAFELYTHASAKLFGEPTRLGALEPGMLADVVAYPKDPLTVPIDELPTLKPAFTIVGGLAAHDPRGMLS
jgi:predicted amidohydrolase YtcJ